MTQVLQELRRSEPGRSVRSPARPREVNVETLHQATGLARGTVHNALTRLTSVLEPKRFRAPAVRGRRGGKPTILYRLKPEAGQALVLDFNHDRVTAWRADSLGNVFPLGGEPVEVDEDAEKAIIKGAGLLRKVSRVGWQTVVGIGLSIPAPVDPESHNALGHVLPGWETVDVDDLLREQLREQCGGRELPIVVDNDANLAALAEYRLLESLPAEGGAISNLVLVKTVPGHIGIGAGAIVNGEQVRGRGFAMELGHLAVDTPIPEGAREVECPHCRRTDCLQARISTDALIGGDRVLAWDDVVRQTRERLLSLRGAQSSAREAGDADEVERLEADLQALATENRYAWAIKTAGEEMGRALAKVVTLLDPDAIVLEGELAKAWLDTGAGSMREIIGDPLNQAFVDCSPFPEVAVLPTLASSGSNCAGGAAAAVLDEHLVDFILDRV